MSQCYFWDWFCKINENSQCSYQNSGIWNLYLSVWSPGKAAVQAKNGVRRAGDTSWAVLCTQEPWAPPSVHMLGFAPPGVVTRFWMNLQVWLTLLFSSWPFLLSGQDLKIPCLLGQWLPICIGGTEQWLRFKQWTNKAETKGLTSFLVIFHTKFLK